jgi:hypothetical protein
LVLGNDARPLSIKIIELGLIVAFEKNGVEQS